MTLVRRTSPFGDILSLRQAMDRLFEESFVNPRTWSALGSAQIAPMDVYVTDDALVVEVQLPGLKPEDVDITVEGNTLTLTGEVASAVKQDEQSFVVQEIKRGRFSRTLTLPDGLEPDKATAEFEDGVLNLRIPKAEQVKPRQIKINADGQHIRPSAITSGDPAGNGTAGNGTAGSGTAGNGTAGHGAR